MTHFETTGENFRNKKGRTRRIDNFKVVFKNGICDGWVFEVPECFRTTLDIMLSTYVDKQLSLQQGTKAFSEVWTRGNPPQRSFTTGDVFYEPSGIRKMVWSEAIQILRRSIQVIDAKADSEDGASGWAKIKLTEYANGKPFIISEIRVSQAELEDLLRTGCLGVNGGVSNVAASGG